MLSELSTLLKQYEQQYNTALIYMSDHGESLGENGLYLHSTPYAFAPDEQTKIPMQLYLPEKAAQDMGLDKKCLSNYALQGAFSHDNIFHSLLGFMQVQSPHYQADLDIFSRCRTAGTEEKTQGKEQAQQ